eukprot:NODE_25_length_41203_cov_0.917113.p9 type:complete len:425 gc:universal NODE_25_length_41203_cov_0.917113:3245-4519(+)
MFVQTGYHHFLFQDDLDFVIRPDDFDALCCVELIKNICKNYSVSSTEHYIPQSRTVLGININSPLNKNKERVLLTFLLNQEDVYDESAIVLVDQMTQSHRNIIPTWCAFKMLEATNDLKIEHAYLTAVVIYYYYMLNLIDYQEYLQHLKEIQLIFPEIQLHEHLFGYLFGMSDLFSVLKHSPHLFYVLKWYKNEQLARHLAAHAGIHINLSKQNKSTEMTKIYNFVNKAEMFRIEKSDLLIHCVKCPSVRNMDLSLYALYLLDNNDKYILSALPKMRENLVQVQLYLETITSQFGLLLQQRSLILMPQREGITMSNCDFAHGSVNLPKFAMKWLSCVLSNIYDTPILLHNPEFDLVASDPHSRIQEYYDQGNLLTIIHEIYEEQCGFGMYSFKSRQDMMEIIEQLGLRMRAYKYEEEHGNEIEE